MRALIPILFVTFFPGCGTEEYKQTIETYSDGKTRVEYIYPDKNNESNYDIIEYYNNGQISFKATVDDKKFIGVKTSYFENGNLKQVDSLTNPCDLDFCCCDGKVSKYYSNGKLDQTFDNKNGSANGLVTLYGSDSSGKIWSIRHYKDNKQNGVTKTFYESGSIYKLETFKEDTLTGYVYYFNDKGDTTKILSTWNGEEDFPVKKWLTNGQIFYASYVENNYKKALYRWTDKAGNELKREVVSPQTGGEWVTSSGKWITPN